MNDPIAVLLVVGLIDWIELPDYGLGDIPLLFLQELGVGPAVGIAVGWIAVQGLRRASLGGESGYAIGTIRPAAGRVRRRQHLQLRLSRRLPRRVSSSAPSRSPRSCGALFHRVSLRSAR